MSRVPGYLKHRGQDGRLRARVRVNGRDIPLGPYGSPESHARYADVIRQWQTGLLVSAAPSALTVAELAARFLRHVAETYRRADGTARPEASQFPYALAPLTRLYGALPAADLTPNALREVTRAAVSGSWRTEGERVSQAARGKPSGCCRRVANRRLTRLKTMVRWAGGEGLLTGDLMHRLLSARGLNAEEADDYEPVPPVSEDVLARTLPELSTVVRALVEYQLLTACRPGEACAVRPCDFDRSGQVEVLAGWKVSLGKSVWAVVPARHKTRGKGKRRIILVGPRAQAVIAPLLSGRAPGAYLFSPREAAEEHLRAHGRKVRHGRGRAPGERYTVSAYWNAIQSACGRAGAEPFGPNRLRHLAASKLVEQWGDQGLELARILLGHAHVQTTKIYAVDNLRKAAEAVEKAG